MRRGSFCPLLRCRLNRSTQHRRQISLLGFQIARSHVAVRLADEPLCSDRLASAPTSRCPLESTVSAGHWCSRSTRAATGFADRKNIRRFWSPTLCPQSRTLHWSDGNEEVSITPPSNCALQLQASFRQSMVEAAARQYAKSRHGALRILRRHNPNNLGADCSRMQQQEHTGPAYEK